MHAFIYPPLLRRPRPSIPTTIRAYPPTKTAVRWRSKNVHCHIAEKPHAKIQAKSQELSIVIKLACTKLLHITAWLMWNWFKIYKMATYESAASRFAIRWPPLPKMLLYDKSSSFKVRSMLLSSMASTIKPARLLLTRLSRYVLLFIL